MDALEDRTLVNVMLRHHPRAHFVSARSGEGLQALRSAILSQLRARTVEVEIEVVQRAADVVSFCYREGHVQRQDVGPHGEVRLHVTFQDALFQRFAKLHGGDFRVLHAGGILEDPDLVNPDAFERDET
jgi:50S ribosomal subunit-associated GTPase HflX